jgi:hypothetical protein
LNNVLADDCGTVEFLGRDAELTNDPMIFALQSARSAMGARQTPQMCLVQPAFCLLRYDPELL